jgi:hypothetical protein
MATSGSSRTSEPARHEVDVLFGCEPGEVFTGRAAREYGCARDDSARTKRVALGTDVGGCSRERSSVLEEPGDDQLPLGLPGKGLGQPEQ